MAYDQQLAVRVRNYMAKFDLGLNVEEKEMFGGLAFMINNKMCINISEENLMCRFDPSREEEVSLRKGYLPMIMNGRYYKGYCYVEPEGYTSNDDFQYWLLLCLSFNEQAKSSKKK